MAPSSVGIKSSGPTIRLNPQRILNRVLRNWYWVLLCLVIGFVVSWSVNRYTTKIYPVKASVIFKIDEENYGANLLYGNSFTQYSRNYYDEFYLMRSYPLLQRVVENLRLDVAYFVQGEIKTIEKYIPHLPVRINPTSGQRLPYGQSFTYRLLNENEFLFYPAQDASDADRNQKHLYNDTIEVAGHRLFFLKTDLLKDKWIGSEYIVRFTDPFELAVSYSTQLNLSWSEQGSGAINISMNGAVPEKIVDFLREFIEQYQQFDVERKSRIYSKSVQFLDRQIDLIGDSLRYYERKMSAVSVKATKNIKPSAERLNAIGLSLDEKELQIRLQQRYYDYLENYMNSTSDFSQVLLPSSLGVSDPVLSELVSRLVKLQFELRVLQNKATDTRNPLVQESLNKIEYLKRDIEEGIRSAKEIMAINRTFFKERLVEMERALRESPEDQFNDLAHLQRNYRLNEGLYSFIIQKRAEASLSKASTTSDVNVLNYPQVGEVITPKPMQNYTLGLLGGFMLPVLFFVFIEALNNRIQSKEDIESLCAVPVIGTISHFTGQTNLAVADKPRSYLAESFRALRANLNYFTGGKDKKVILVTSTLSGEGKSFTSINLATVLAFSGKKTVLIAGDMRKASIVQDFGVSNKNGLSSYLSGQSELDSIITSTQVVGLDFITPGPIPPNPAELYMSNRTQALIDHLLDRYDFVLIDSPPIGLVSDAMALIPLVDHILFVTRQNYTPLTAINQLQYMVDQGQVQQVSIVLNDIQRLGMGYGYKYGYAYDYGYGSREGKRGYFGKTRNEGSEEITYGA